MSFLDRLAAKVMPPESAEDRANARRLAQSKTGGDDWLAIVLDQHKQLEDLFSRARTSCDAATRRRALKELQILLTGHANAEETVLYPALVEHGENTHATMSYEEHAMTKVQLAQVERLDPMSQDWREKLEHIEGAVRHHMYAEEGTRFAELHQNLAPGEGQRLTQRFLEDFERYAGAHQAHSPGQMAAQQSAALGQQRAGSPGAQQQGSLSSRGATDF